MITRFDGKSQIALELCIIGFQAGFLLWTIELKFQGFSPFIAGDDAVAAVVASGFQNFPQELGVKGERTGLMAGIQVFFA